MDVTKLTLTSDSRRIEDLDGKRLLLFVNSWSVDWAVEHNKGLQLSEFSRN